jgi:hypothetical protein
VERAFHFDSIGFGIWYVEGPLWEFWEWDWAPVYAPIYDVNLVSYFGDYRWYSGYGGGAYCDIGSNVSFVNCEIRGNRAEGGMSGVGGQPAMEPYVAYEIPSFGAGVYCAVDSVITFTDCTFEDNIASALTVGITDPNHRLDPYSGYGGGVCAEDSASVVFVNCDFVGNEADTGGGMYTDNTDVTIIDSNLASNTALRGGGFVGANGLINITGTEIANNSAIADINDPNVDAYYGNGAGLFCWLGGNIADYSGGGVYLRDVNTASLVNNLITNNEAGRDGGGVSANWFTRSVISNCTFAGNDATGNFGEPNNSGFGGGLYNSYESNSVITDSIFWNNFALKGDAILVGTDFRFDKRPSTVTISYSDIGQASIWVDDESTLNWGDGNIEADPLFTQGPRGGYYLSQIGAGQTENSPAVDAGSDYASYVGMVGYTTRTDEILDAGRVDMGYHHPGAEPCRLCDLVLDGVINFCDFAVLAERWLDDTCSEGNNWCNGADLTSDMYVDMRDIAFLSDCWLVEDTAAPIPNPSRWETEPYFSSGTSVTMTAETATDAWGWDVEYYFESVNGNDSGWQQSTTYTDTGLDTNSGYGYRLKARDGVGNETDWSQTIFVSGIDRTPPIPDPNWVLQPSAISGTEVTMEVTTASDASGVEYYFENITDNLHDSGWQDGTTYTDTGLDPNTSYSYRVQARDKSPAQNETAWSPTVAVITTPTGAVDFTPPAPDPMEWDPTVDPNGFDGMPREIDNGGGSFDFWAVMTAIVAIDAGGGPVEYFFECTTNAGFSSGWIAFPAGQAPTYTVLLGRTGQGHRFRVRARDQFGNETAWSPEVRADPP